MKRSRSIASAAWQVALWWTFTVFLLAACPGRDAGAQKLGTVHTIFIAPVEAGSNASAIANRLKAQLEHSGSLRIVSDPAAADAVLHATASIWAIGTVSPSLHSNSMRDVNYQGHLSAELISRDRADALVVYGHASQLPQFQHHRRPRRPAGRAPAGRHSQRHSLSGPPPAPRPASYPSPSRPPVRRSLRPCISNGLSRMPRRTPAP